MNGWFNKDLMLKNITYMLTEFGKKIGELENEAGVSPGYISRTAKEEKSKPGIDFVVKVAEALNMSVDTLIGIDLSALTPTEKYLISFFEKLKKDTVEDKLEWQTESHDQLNRMKCDMNGYAEHPLFSNETFYEEGETEYPDEVTCVVMTSHSFGVHTSISGDCFNLRLKNGAILYLMDISKSVYRTDDPNAHAKEVWMFKPGGSAQFLCSDEKGSPLAKLVDDLYTIVAEFSKHPKIKSDLKDSIDAFMKDDWADDPEEMPF